MPERMAYAIDDARWPLVVARATKHSDAAALEASYRTLEAILDRKQQFVLLFDVRGATSSSSRRRNLLSWCERHADALTRYLAVGAIVAASSIERGFVTASLWLRSPPWPMRVFADPDAAETWLLSELATPSDPNQP
jgi:hypothetical protein